MKTLVVCIDGTGNFPGQVDYDSLAGVYEVTETNVAKTWRALTGATLDVDRPYGSMASLVKSPGFAIYLNGVATEGSALQEKADGVTGTGTSQRIKDAYRFLAERWEPGDMLYFFGFSRGAFAVRSLCGFIDYIGLPKRAQLIRNEELDVLYGSYRQGCLASAPSWTAPATVNFLGLWDTVGALALNRTVNRYHRVSPSNAQHIAHALALDERRSHFAPTAWDIVEPQQVDEVWFRGAHSNIGGGYSDSNLSNIAFFWVLGKALDRGLQLNLELIDGWSRESSYGPARLSNREFWSAMGTLGRWVTALKLFDSSRAILPGQKIHQSVFDAAERPEFQPTIYIPANTRTEPWGFED